MFRLTSTCFFFFFPFFFFLKADYYVCLLVKRKKDGTVIGRTNSAHRTLDIAMYSDCSATANAWSLPLTPSVGTAERKTACWNLSLN